MCPAKLEKPDRLGKAVRILASVAGLSDNGLFEVDKFFMILIHASADCFGPAIEFVIQAVSEAKANGDTVVYPDHFADVFEDRIDCAEDQNPFLVTEWHLIDTKKMMTRARKEQGAPNRLTG
ncbi:hypothetical protein RA29_16520 [Tateyamaria sp. ANG-S1]|nr:hypothetical protein RA29_16520 [Tateyamaria sp. ANG-S1]